MRACVRACVNIRTYLYINGTLDKFIILRLVLHILYCTDLFSAPIRDCYYYCARFVLN